MADNWTTPFDWSSGAVLTETQLDEQVRDNLTAVFNALTADASADSAIWHGHKSGTLANRPAAAHANRLYYATDLGVQFLDTGSRWDIIGVNNRVCEHIFDEFGFSRAGSPFTTNAAGELGGWAISASGGQFQMSGAKDYSFLQASVLGSASGNVVSMSNLSSGQHYQMDLASDRVPAIVYDRLRTLQTTNQTLVFGIASSVGGLTPDGVYFKRTDTASAGTWVGICRAAGVQSATTLTTGVAVADTSYHDFEIVIESLTSVKFYVDGSQLTPTLTTNIPTTTDMALHFYLTNTAAELKHINRDRVDMWARR